MNLKPQPITLVNQTLSLVVTRQWVSSTDINHPISFLPPALISKIFVDCLPPLGTPSPRNAPLLTAQICGLWREIALQTPELWIDILARDRASLLQMVMLWMSRENALPSNFDPQADSARAPAVQSSKLWLSRAGSLPLRCVMISGHAERGRLLVEAALPHHRQLGFLFLSVPWVSYASIFTLTDASFPALHSLQLSVSRRDSSGILSTKLPNLNSRSKLVIRDAPKLCNVDISARDDDVAFPLRLLDVPWGQLETLNVEIENDTWAESLSKLLLCTNLVALTVTAHPDVQRAPTPAKIKGHITMSLQELDLGPHLAAFLDHVTLPDLLQLRISLSGDTHDLLRIQSLFARAPCQVHFLILTLEDPQFLRQFLALAPSIVMLSIESPAPEILELAGTALLPGVLPSLGALCLKYPIRTDSAKGRAVFIDMLKTRLVDKPECVRLRSFLFELRGDAFKLFAPAPYVDVVLAGMGMVIGGCGMKRTIGYKAGALVQSVTPCRFAV
ncbi:hypothetical protein K438DRAFT_515232 [Mycena galopus ATCC 62051]|nr:hypothetical protein K438DRAFT_515232 [Mycena galopus ATCC 62051]